MNPLKTFALLVPLAAVTFSDLRDASACGGCFVPPDANTQVTGHRMVLSVSPGETTLWDQIVYSGEPESFAWVLPTKGVVEIGVSSDLLFNTLAFMTDPQVIPPYLNCPNSCDYGSNVSSASVGAGAGGGSAGGGVDVIAEEVVGPYATVQLSADDPTALQTWLADNGYSVPPDITPLIDTYVNEGFNFLAIKLVPGQGIDSMKPVRITTPGAMPSLPLRMVAAGTGAITPITLWVVGEGRYAPTNFGQFDISVDELVWNWDTSDSNYSLLKQEGFDASAGKSWLIESALPTSPFSIENTVFQVVYNLPDQSGYGDINGVGAEEEATADLDALYGAVDMGSMWVTRMHGQLPRAALATDLVVGASMDQAEVPNVYNVSSTIGTPPVCPPDPCGSGSGYTTGSGNTSGGGGSSSGGYSAGGGGCALSGASGLPAAGTLGLVLALAFARRRRRPS